jgi:hypothetical protein
MSRLRVVKGLAIGACVVMSCRFETAEPQPRPEPTAPSGGTESEVSPSYSGETAEGGTPGEARGGEGAEARGGSASGGRSYAGEGPAQAGQGGQGLGPDGGDGGAPPTDCEVDGGCETKCEQQTHVCQLTDPGLACEFKMFAGTKQELTCGELTSVGKVNCGACGEVDFKVLFDGENCWQGIPDCERYEFEGRLFRIVD